MARLPNSRDIGYAQAPSPQGVVRLPVPERGVTGQAIADVGTAAHEIITRLQDAQTETEVRRSDLETALALDQARRNLQSDPDGWAQYEQRFSEQAKKIIGEREASLGSMRARQLYRERAEQRLAQATVDVRDLSRRTGVSGALAGLTRQEATARQVIDDDTVDEKLRADALASYTQMARSMAAQGFIERDDAERMVAQTEDYYRKAGEQRSLVAGAQRAADAVFGNAALVSLDDKLNWVRANVPEGRARAAAEDEVTQRFQRKKVAEEDELDGAMGRAYAAIEAGRTVDTLSPQDLDVITRNGRRNDLRNYARNRLGGGDGSGWTAMTRASKQFRDQFLGMADAEDTAPEFARMDLESVRRLLTPDDFNQLRQKQRELRGEAPAGGAGKSLIQQTYDIVREHAEIAAGRAGVNVTYGGAGPLGDTGDKSEAAVALRQTRDRFRGFFYAEARAFVEQNNRMPKPNEVDEIVALGMRKYRAAPTGGILGIGQRAGREQFGFEAGKDAPIRETSVDRIPAYRQARIRDAYAASIRSGDRKKVRLPFSQVPSQFAQSMAEQRARVGAPPPTAAEVEEAYWLTPTDQEMLDLFKAEQNAR